MVRIVKVGIIIVNTIVWAIIIAIKAVALRIVMARITS